MAQSTHASVLAALKAYGGGNISTSELQEKVVLQNAASKYADMIQEELYGALGLPQQYIQQSNASSAAGAYLTKEELDNIFHKYGAFGSMQNKPDEVEDLWPSDLLSPEMQKAAAAWGDWHQRQSTRKANRQPTVPTPPICPVTKKPQPAQSPTPVPAKAPTPPSAPSLPVPAPAPDPDLPVRVVDKTPSMPKARRVGSASPFDPEA